MKFDLITKECIDCKRHYQSKVFKILDQSRSFDGGRCPECRTAYIDKMAAKDKLDKEMEYARIRQQFKNQSGIPLHFINKDFEQFDKSLRKKAYRDCLKYAEEFPISHPQGYKSLVLYSKDSWGQGKTFLVTAIGNRIISRWNGERCGCPVYFISEQDLFRSIRATYSYNSEEKTRLDSEEDIINRCIARKLFILDDMGKEAINDMKFVQRVLFSIINGRYNADLPMVITANLDLEGISHHLGAGVGNQAAFDRLKEMTGGWSIEMVGKSHREIESME